jgi:methionyl aminopeptidase
MNFVDEMVSFARRDGRIKIHGPEGFEGMRRAGRLAAECLDMLTPHVVPGVSTRHLDDLAREFVLDHGAYPACLFYKGYGHTVCISPNHVVCHGIPGSRTNATLSNGDIVNIDVTVVVDGWHGDTSRMYPVGEVKAPGRRLIDVTYEGMMRGLAAIKPGAHLNEIGRAIQAYVESQRCSVGPSPAASRKWDRCWRSACSSRSSRWSIWAGRRPRCCRMAGRR